MEENKNNIIKMECTVISSVVLDSLKNNLNASKNNDFAIYTDTSQTPVAILISLGQGHKKIISTIQKKLDASEFVVAKNNKNEDELYFVFLKKDLVGQSNNDLVRDVLLLPSDKILDFFNILETQRGNTALQLAKLFRGHIIDNKDMNWIQQLAYLYTGKNNENNNINQENNNINLNNNLNNNIPNENNENNINNIKEEEIKNENNNTINTSIDVNGNINQNKENKNININLNGEKTENDIKYNKNNTGNNDDLKNKTAQQQPYYQQVWNKVFGGCCPCGLDSVTEDAEQAIT